ncbi:ABC transporter ATP-binding protein [Micrococcus lylae]|uniref:ABC transporter ATP-binding protein n=1 Tax=Micrococcus lylae TaxID=1273 RepID=A0A1R4JRG2_9MICC|nr:ABC transporter ATP-binding protein [Micrococcus lylae]
MSHTTSSAGTPVPPAAETATETATETAAGTSGTSVIRARGLRKHYGDFHAVQGIDLDVTPGECFGLLGPNGAGKSTTMRMLAGVSQRTAGELSIMGIDPEEDGPAVRAHLGVVPQQDNLDEELTARDNLLIYGRYFGLPYSYLKPKSLELLEFAQLTDKADTKADALSGGMKRRLVIARALVNEPQLLLLDEPTTGLDPQARHILWDRLYRLKERGTTLVLTTHYMDEAEQLCDRLVVVDGGQIMAAGTPQALIREHASREVLEVRFGTDRNEAAAEVLRAETRVHRIEVLPDRVLLYGDRADELQDAVAALAAAGRVSAPVTALTRRASLEDVFLILTGRTLVD